MWWHLFERHRNPNLQHDNGRANSTRATIVFLQQNNIEVIPLSALTPDLNPTGHLLDDI